MLPASQKRIKLQNCGHSNILHKVDETQIQAHPPHVQSHTVTGVHVLVVGGEQEVPFHTAH